MKERAVKEWPATVTIWRRRDNALGFMPEMTPEEKARYGTENFAFKDYVPQQRVNALVKALEEIDASLIAQPDGTFEGYGALGDTLRVIKAHAAGALANYKEGEA